VHPLCSRFATIFGATIFATIFATYFCRGAATEPPVTLLIGDVTDQCLFIDVTDTAAGPQVWRAPKRTMAALLDYIDDRCGAVRG
jgi:hypothetical protein